MKRAGLLCAGVLLAAGIAGGCGGTSQDISKDISRNGSGAETMASAEQTPEDVSEGEIETESEETEESEETSASPVAEAEGERGRSEVVEMREEQPVPDELSLWSSLPFSGNDGEWELQIFVSREAMAAGAFAPDDSCRFFIRAVSPEGEYCFFDDRVQLGTPAADVWTDEQNRLHVVVRDFRTARYRITDYLFDEQRKAFYGVVELDYDGINYWGSLDVQEPQP